MVALSRLAQAEAAPGEPTSARAVAEAEGLSLPLVSAVLKRLHRAGLVASQRGVDGGYYLAQAPEQIRVAEVIRATMPAADSANGGPQAVRLALCCGRAGARQGNGQGGETGCRLEQRCPIVHTVRRLNDRLGQFLGTLTLADLLAPSPASSPESPQPAASPEAATTGTARAARTDGS